MLCILVNVHFSFVTNWIKYILSKILFLWHLIRTFLLNAKFECKVYSNKLKSWSRLLKKVRISKHTFGQHLELLLWVWHFSGCFKLVRSMIFFLFFLEMLFNGRGLGPPFNPDANNYTSYWHNLTNKVALISIFKALNLASPLEYLYWRL